MTQETKGDPARSRLVPLFGYRPPVRIVELLLAPPIQPRAACRQEQRENQLADER